MATPPPPGRRREQFLCWDCQRILAFVREYGPASPIFMAEVLDGEPKRFASLAASLWESGRLGKFYYSGKVIYCRPGDAPAGSRTGHKTTSQRNP